MKAHENTTPPLHNNLWAHPYDAHISGEARSWGGTEKPDTELCTIHVPVKATLLVTLNVVARMDEREGHSGFFVSSVTVVAHREGNGRLSVEIATIPTGTGEGSFDVDTHRDRLRVLVRDSSPKNTGMYWKFAGHILKIQDPRKDEKAELL